ncbi:MarR family transcriptional regulator [Streptomyces sp. NPDC014894]|uniref:MarR family transcriptional regulator n=1 Tax=unclassified Streptomyces TaxID=2593676 RepID=UPI0036FCB2A9
MKTYTEQELAAQPIGYWSGEAYRTIVAAIRAGLAEEALTQPHWWILNHVAGRPGHWTRGPLAARLITFDDQDTDFDEVFDDLVRRGWLAEPAGPAQGALTLTGGGEAGRARARARTAEVTRRIHEGVGTEEYTAALQVLRRMIDNLGGRSDLP